jgi:hypothetical protein
MTTKKDNKIPGKEKKDSILKPDPETLHISLIYFFPDRSTKKTGDDPSFSPVNSKDCIILTAK